MPIVIRLDEMMERRNMSLTELSQAIDITLANLSILKTGKARAVLARSIFAVEGRPCQRDAPACDLCLLDGGAGLSRHPLGARVRALRESAW